MSIYIYIYIYINIYIYICTVNFLDTTVDIMNNSYKPYQRPSDEPLYINKHSNHPPSVLCQPAKWIFEISSNEEIFMQSVSIDEKALRDSCFDEKAFLYHHLDWSG